MNNSASAPEFASIPEVSVKFGVSDATVRRLLRDGKLEYIKVGAQIRILQSSVSRLAGGK